MTAAQGAASGAASGASGGFGGALIGAGLGAVGGFLDERSSRKMRRRQRKAINQAREFTNAEFAKLSGEGTIIDNFRKRILDLQTNPLDSAQSQDFAKSLASAQSQRGLFTGNASIASAAFGQSAFAQKLALQAGAQGSDFNLRFDQQRRNAIDQDARLRVAAATGAQIFGAGNLGSPAASIGQGAIAGGLGGFQIAQAFNNQQATPTPDQASSGVGPQLDASQAGILELLKQFQGGGQQGPQSTFNGFGG